jgi:glycosyltransferase involved in cell wall biosynthesis
MSRVPPARTIVSFSTAIDASARDSLLSALALDQITATVGFDLGERGPVPDMVALRAAVALLGAAATGADRLARAAVVARDWLADRADPGYVEVEIKASGAVVRVRGRDPYSAMRQLTEVLPSLSAAGPIGWQGDSWAVEADVDEVDQTAEHRSGGTRRPRVLMLDTHWFSVKGGISTFNRQLAAALARAGADVVCVVLSPADPEVKHASARGVRLVGAPPVPAGTDERAALLRRPPVDAGWTPDIVIGHGHITGSHAQVQCTDHFRSAARGHIVHTWSDHIEWHRIGKADAGATAERRWIDDIELARTADRAFAVGPLLHGELAKAMSRGTDRVPVRLDPGFDLDDSNARTPPTWRQKTIMVRGRLDDWPVKGLDISARIVGAATRQIRPVLDVELLLRGVPIGEHGPIRQQVLAWAGLADLQVTPRTFSVSMDDLHDDLLRSSLLLLPARAEGFGLAGLEAIVAGTPLLVSARTGLGLLLQEKVPEDAGRFVLPVGNDPDDLDRWTSFTIGVLRDEAGAFATAERVRKSMAEQVTSAAAARAVLEPFGW